MLNYSYSDPEYIKKQSIITKLNWQKGLYNFKIKPLETQICKNSDCKKEFKTKPSDQRPYCSHSCAAHITNQGRKLSEITKQKISHSVSLCFYSTWEANVARVFNLIHLKWVYAPIIFDLGEHTYRPDFYLPDFDMFIEVKNFMGEYSLKRHNLFKEKFPNVKLELIMKEEYKEIKENYKDFVKNWEY